MGIYPYGYDYHLTADNALEVEKGIINPVTFFIEAGDRNIISIMVSINSFINNWLKLLLLIPLFVAGVFGFFKAGLRGDVRLRTYAIIYLILLLVVLSTSIVIFQNQNEEILSLLIDSMP